MAQSTENARSYTLSAPVGGWNTRDPLIAMPETDAIVMDNVIPQSSYCRSRGAIKEFADLGTGAVHTTCTLSDASANEYLVGICATDIFNATAGGSGSSIKGAATITSGTPWQSVNFRNRLFLVNGTDQPLDWTGSGNVNATAWTGSGLTITNLINVSCYKRRLYFVEKNTCKVWYTEAVDNITGALLPFNPSSIFSLGGKLLYAGPTSTSTSRDGNNELFCFVSTQGEIVVYAGDNPLSSTWNIVGHYYVGRAIGHRCTFNVGGDLHIITFDGVIPMSQLLSGVDITNDYQTLSGKIKPTFVEYAADYSRNDTWMGCYYPSGPYAVINVPIEDSGNAYQLVFNTVTKAWCRFTGINAHSWCTVLLSGREYLICGHSTNGKIYKVDDPEETILLDSLTTPIPIDVQQAFSWLGNPQQDKILQFIQPYFYMDAASIAAQPRISYLNIGFAFDYEYINDTTDLPLENFSVASVFGSVTINGANNTKIIDTLGSGKQVSLRYAGSLSFDPDPGSDVGYSLRHYASKVFYLAGSEIA